MFAPWQQTASGSGQLVAFYPQERRQEIHAPISGRVTHWYVQEGQKVKEGDRIADLGDVDPKYTERLALQERALNRRLEATIDQASAIEKQIVALRRARTEKLKAATQKIRGAEQKHIATLQAVTAAQVALETADANAKRIQGLAKEGLMADRDAEVAKLKRAKALAILRKTESQVMGAKATVLQVKAERDSLGAELLGKIAKSESEQKKALVNVAKAEADRVKIHVVLARQAEQHISAPVDGVIAWVQGNRGANLVKSGSLLAVLIPNVTRWAVELWVSGNDVPLVHPGRNVRLQLEGWPAVQMVGWPQVAVGTFGGVVSFVDPISNGKSGFRIMVEPDPKSDPWPDAPLIRQGGKAKAWVLLDEVALGFELWRRLNGFPVGIGSPPPNATKKADK